MAIRYNKKLVIIMIMLILFSCTSCGVKQNTDKQEVKKKDNVGGGLSLCKFYGYILCGEK